MPTALQFQHGMQQVVRRMLDMVGQCQVGRGALLLRPLGARLCHGRALEVYLGSTSAFYSLAAWIVPAQQVLDESRLACKPKAGSPQLTGGRRCTTPYWLKSSASRGALLAL